MNSLKADLRSGRRLVGTFISSAEPALAELVAEAVDLVVVDLEHGALGARDVQALAIAGRAGGASVAVRVTGIETEALTAILDAGVAGVVVPHVDTPEQARRAVDRLRYPPEGSRGYGPRRASGYGRDGEYWREASERLVCIAQIESAAAVAAARHIAAVDGVDALLLGPADLSFDLGVPLRSDAAAVRDAIATVQRAAAAEGVAFAFASNVPPAELAGLVDSRCTVLLQATDVRIYAAAVDDVAKAARAALDALPAAPDHPTNAVEAGAAGADLHTTERALRPF